MIPGFEDGIIGMSAGENTILDLKFPKDYHAEDLKGAKVKYVGRNAAASPATGNLNKHLAEQKEILEKVVGRLT